MHYLSGTGETFGSPVDAGRVRGHTGAIGSIFYNYYDGTINSNTAGIFNVPNISSDSGVQGITFVAKDIGGTARIPVFGITNGEKLYVRVDNLNKPGFYSDFIISGPVTQTLDAGGNNLFEYTSSQITTYNLGASFDQFSIGEPGSSASILLLPIGRGTTGATGEDATGVTGPGYTAAGVSGSVAGSQTIVFRELFHDSDGNQVLGATRESGPVFGNTGDGITLLGITDGNVKFPPNGYTLTFRPIHGGVVGATVQVPGTIRGATGNTGLTGISVTGATFHYPNGPDGDTANLVLLFGYDGWEADTSSNFGYTMNIGNVRGRSGSAANRGTTGPGVTAAGITGFEPGLGYTLTFRTFIYDATTDGLGVMGATIEAGRIFGATGTTGGFGFQYVATGDADVHKQGGFTSNATGLTFSELDESAIGSRSVFSGIINNSSGNDLIYIIGQGNTGYRVYKTTTSTAIKTHVTTSPGSYSINNLSVLGEVDTTWPDVGDRVSVSIAGSGMTGNTGPGITSAGICGNNLYVRFVDAFGVLGETADLGRVVGPTGPVGGTSPQYIFYASPGQAGPGGGPSGNTGLQFDETNLMPKFNYYRETITTIGAVNALTTGITLGPGSGPVQKVMVNSIPSSGISFGSFTDSQWAPGQGVSVIIETPTSGDLTWATSPSDTNQYFDSVPQFEPGKTTMIYVLVDGTDLVGGGGLGNKYYITSQVFGNL